MKKNTKRTLTAIAVSALVLGGAGVAVAYWSAGGTGTGSAATGTTLAVNVTQTSTITDLRPGGAAQDIEGTFTNLNDAPTYVATVTVSITSVTGGAGSCSAADYTLTGAIMTVATTVDDGDTWGGATIQFNNTGANQDGCKGATVNLGYVVA